MVRLLEAHGVDTIFGLCGDTTLPLYDALYRIGGSMTHVLTRDERCASYMADAYARVTGKVGVCEGPSGGGATYIAPGLVEANESSVPVLAITTDVSTNSIGRYPLTELDQDGLFKPLTKWNGVIPTAEMMPRMVRAAFRAMTTGRPGSAHLGLPFDVQKQTLGEDDIWGDPVLGQYPAMRAAPDPAAIEGLVDALLSARNPVVICGGGIVIAGGEAALMSLAASLDLPIATTISGQGAIPDSDPHAVGVVGSNGGIDATREVVEGSDLVLYIGCRAGSVTTERWRFPAPGTRILHIDSDPMVLGANYKTEVSVCADARFAVEAMLEELARRTTKSELPQFGGAAKAAKARATKAAEFMPLATSNEAPILPERLIHDLSAVLPDDAVIVADPGTPCPYLSAFYDIRKPGRTLFSNRAHGALGYSLSAALGAAFGRPDAKVVAMMGDGSFGFTCGELETVVRTKKAITYIVVSNSVYGWIKAGQKSGFGERYYSVDFNRTDHAAVASAFGVKSWRVEDPRDLRRVLAEAVAHDGPTLVDVLCQPLQDAKAPVSEWVA